MLTGGAEGWRIADGAGKGKGGGGVFSEHDSEADSISTVDTERPLLDHDRRLVRSKGVQTSRDGATISMPLRLAFRVTDREITTCFVNAARRLNQDSVKVAIDKEQFDEELRNGDT